jgi:hypothetical protein
MNGELNYYCLDVTPCQTCKKVTVFRTNLLSPSPGCKRPREVKVMLRSTVSTNLSWCQATIWGPIPDFCYCWTVAGCPIWREDGSVVCNSWWSSPAQSFLGPSSAELMTIFYCLKFETPPTWRARSLYLYPPGTGWKNYTPRHWVPFSSPPTTHRADRPRRKTMQQLLGYGNGAASGPVGYGGALKGAGPHIWEQKSRSAELCVGLAENFTDVMPWCSTAAWRFGGTYHLHVLGWKVMHARHGRKAGGKLKSNTCCPVWGSFLPYSSHAPRLGTCQVRISAGIRSKGIPNLATTASFHISSSSLLTNRPTITYW